MPAVRGRLSLLMRRLVSLCTIALGIVPAMAATADGPYVSAAGGVALVPGFTDTPHDLVRALDGAGSASADATEEEVTLRFRPKGDSDWAFDVGFVAGGALGYAFGPARIDVEFSYLSANFEFASDSENGTETPDDNFTALSLLAQAWYDVDLGSFLTPYLGLGAGATNLAVKLSTDDDTWFDGAAWGFAYQAGAGIAFRILAGFSLDIGYRFFGTLQTEVFDNADPDLSSLSPAVMAHRIQLGLRFPT